jgi:hypothetical protein
MGLSVLFLASCAFWISGDFAFALQAHKITGSIEWQPATDVLTRRLAGFALAVLVVHLLLGAAGWALARLTIAAMPRLPARHDYLVISAWLAVLVALALLANAAWFPQSRFADEGGLLHSIPPGVPLGLALAAGVAAIALAVVAVARQGGLRMRRRHVPLAALAVIAAGGAFLFQGAAGSPDRKAWDAPHVVILGVDSLRNDMSEALEDGRSLTPRIDAFLQGAHRFDDTISPLARTYGSWVSILTGRHPVSTNARFNLMPRSLVKEGDTLADALRASGYHSVYATDEVRFANFDESYGFDQFITPPVGASDFLLGTIGDLPLVNLVASTAAGRQLFPAQHANRAVYVSYQPGDFVDRLEDEIVIGQPSFLVIHLTLGHWPYSWAGQRMPSTPPEYRDAYRRSIAAVDSQFDEVVGMLERKGVLDNAIVVVLSDHGEALGFPSDTMVRKTGTPNDIWRSIWGHGTSVVSPHQYSVLLALRGFGRVALPGAAGHYDWPVSLEDVRPTLQEFVTGRRPSGVDGLSLLPFLSGQEPASALAPRLRYTETCFNTPMMMTGRIEASGLVNEAIEYYELAPESGWVQLRPDRLHELMEKKQRAVVSRDALLAAIPSWDDESVEFLYTSRRSPLPRRLEGPPDPFREPEAARLWRALQARFPGELAAPAHQPRM